MTVSQVAPGVWRAGTRYVNWYIVDGGSGEGLTVVDAGLPRYVNDLDAALAQLDRSRSDIRALVLSHGHIDHIGMAPALAAAGAAVHLHPGDDELAARPLRNKTERSPLLYMWMPGIFAFFAHLIVQGGLRPQPMPSCIPLADGEVAAVPGRPVVTHVPGHTRGSCLLEFRDHGVVCVGDLLCTVSPVTGRPACPQLQTRGSNRDSAGALASLERLEGVQAPVVLPGHGGPWHGGVASAVASARRIGCR
jgi:glyoxylase-like metal-dependent hydrolase (beta-lactamase superfamily II)